MRLGKENEERNDLGPANNLNFGGRNSGIFLYFPLLCNYDFKQCHHCIK